MGNNIRNLHSFDINLSEKLNVFTGENASGKTSLLEGVHYLTSARSFRTNNSKSVITTDKQSMTLFGRFLSGHNNYPVGIERTKESIRIKLNGKNIQQSSELIRHFPTTVINPDNQNLITAGPSIRRKLIDWGLFHVEHDYLTAQKRYLKILKQRNALLKMRKHDNEIQVWDKSLVSSARIIDAFRKEYIIKLLSELSTLLADIIKLPEVDISYYPGWSDKGLFSDLLTQSIDRDKKVGFTQIGPHRADIQIKVDGIAAAEILSRGQLKLLATAFLLAQMKLINLNSSDGSIVLVDDLAAELDKESRHKILNILLNTKSQIFLTTTDSSLFEFPEGVDKKMFHVERGVLKEVV